MMTNYVNVEELRTGVYFETATLDARFTFQEIIPPDPAVAEVMNGRWMDGQRRFRLIDCAHLEMYRDGKLCTHCGGENYYEPPAAEAARKKRTTK
jgi:hypothetical protein